MAQPLRHFRRTMSHVLAPMEQATQPLVLLVQLVTQQQVAPMAVVSLVPQGKRSSCGIHGLTCLVAMALRALDAKDVGPSAATSTRITIPAWRAVAAAARRATRGIAGLCPLWGKMVTRRSSTR